MKKLGGYKIDRAIHFDNVFLLFVTVAPGAYRICLFFFVNLLFGTSELGSFSSDYSIVTAAQIVSVVGYGTLILKDAAGQPILLSGSIWKSLAWQSMLGGLPIGVIFLLIMWHFGHVVILRDVLSLLVVQHVYQLIRHYGMATKTYRSQFIYELSIFFLTAFGLLGIFCLNLNSEPYLFIVTVGAFAIPSIIVVMRVCISSDIHVRSSPQHWNALQIGASNMVSGGILYFLPNFSRQLGGEHAAGIVGMQISFLTLAQVLPRVWINKIMPQISAEIRNSTYGHASHLLNRARLTKLIVTSSVPIICINVGLLWALDGGANFSLTLLSTSVLLSLYVTFAQTSLLDSFVLVFKGSEKKALWMNATLFLYFSFSYTLIKATLFGSGAVAFLAAFLFIGVVARNRIMTSIINRFL